jgi:hypothetical protein
MATAAEQIATIESTLATLYAKVHSTLTQKDRSATLQDISKLEASLEYWRNRQAIASGTRRRCATIDLSGGA